jgi:cobaltochelatase CobN
MHLLVRETTSLDEAAPAVDLGQAPADIVVLSFSDADLGALAAAPRPAVSLALASLARLRHPLSVDLYLEQTVTGSRCVIIRVLGGLDYWRYGAEEVAALCRVRGIPLALLPGDGGDDPALAALSTVPAAVYARLDAYFRHGGPANMGHALALAAHLAGCGPDDGTAAEAMPQHGIWSPTPATFPLQPKPPASELSWPGSTRPSTRSHSARISGDANDDPTAWMAGSSPAMTKGLAAIVLYRSHLMSADTAPITALADALRSRGLDVGILYAASLKAPASAAYIADTLATWRPDVVLNATGFSARQTTASPLDAADAPVLQLVLAGSSRDAWQASTRGLSPADLAMQVVLPELDGRLLTGAVAFKAETTPDPAIQYARMIHQPDVDGIALAADRAAAWGRLRTTARADRRLAIILSDYPGIGGQRGHAVGLDSFASLAAITALLRDAGYTAAPITALQDAEPTAFLSLAEYAPLFATLPPALQAAVISRWGTPADDPAVANDAFTLRQVRAGHITALLQPDRGDAADRRGQYHDPDVPPRHAYIALYLWLQSRMQAIVHLGTHGSLEWLPGKAAALSATCWPRALLGGLPVIYPFIVNNPGEAAAAKRRLGAVTIGHLTPPLRPAGLHDEAAALERLIDEYAAADGLDRPRGTLLRREILDRASTAGLLAESGVQPGAPDDDALARLDAYLCDVKDLQIRDGLHVYGQPPAADHLPGAAACAPAERAALLAALDGRFIQPGPAGAPSLSRLDVLPTGRNLTSIDPRAIPTRAAMDLAAPAAADLLTRHRQDHGDWPRSVVLNLWGTSTMRTGGADLALALTLLGARPIWDTSSARMSGFEIIPLALLDRPRVDVTLRISGLFRDAFAAQITLFDAITRAIAARDEAADWNPLTAAPGSRIFGPAPGQYGAAIGHQIEQSGWTHRTELAATWLAASAGSYGAGQDGAPDQGALAARLRDADAILHQQDHDGTDLLDSTEYPAHLGGAAAAAESLGADPALYYLDGHTRTLAEQIARIVRGRAANPRWIAGMTRHGYRGAAEIARTVEALHGFAATMPIRLDRQFDLLFDATLGKPDVDAFLQRENPAARAAMAARFAEARQRGLWHPARNAVDA